VAPFCGATEDLFLETARWAGGMWRGAQARGFVRIDDTQCGKQHFSLIFPKSLFLYSSSSSSFYSH
ncbi:hypothetical protein A2U01_0073464, partial [Trifolium medium]|nr:hypothetical protein [Trifolium medium]